MIILGTGLQGLIGSRIVELLATHSFENISRSTGIDITNKDEVFSAISKSKADIVIHLAAKADVDGCENDKHFQKSGEAWRINVEGTRNVAQACQASGKKIIYISTDFVFDGEKEFYREEDSPNPINWYAATKYEGEKIVQALQTPWIIARIAYPYRADFPKKDFFRIVKGRLEKKEPVTMVTDHIMTPTFIDELAKALGKLIEIDQNGIYHIVGSQFVSPYEAALAIAKNFAYDTSLIGQTKREDFFQGRAPRPFRLALKNDKIGRLGVKMSSFDEGLKKIQKQI